METYPDSGQAGKRIQDGQFIEMAELLPDFRSSLNAADEEKVHDYWIFLWALVNDSNQTQIVT